MTRSAPVRLPSQTSEIDAHLHSADGFVAVGQLALALAMYRTAALLAEQRNDLHRALAIHARIARIDPDPGARMRIGEIQLTLGQPCEAAATLDAVARDEFRAGRWAQALHAATTAAGSVPSINRRLVAADLAQRVGQYDLAVDQFHAAADEELGAGRVGPAQALCARALGIRPGHLPTLRTAVEAHLRARDVHRAVAAVRGILAQLPGDAGALESMAEAFAMLGKKSNAAEVVRLLAVQLRSAGLASPDDVRGLVRRGLSWHPESLALQQLERELDDQPRVMVRAAAPESTRVIDLADLVDVRPALPKRQVLPPTPRVQPLRM